MIKYKHEIGYACLNLDTHLGTYKTCRLNDVSEARLRELIEHNLNVLESHIDYNIAHQNHMFRLSSSIIPFGSHSSNTIRWEEEYGSKLGVIRDKIISNNIRVSCHPGQYTVLNSPTEAVVIASIKELEYHARLMEVLSGNRNHKMILHVGGIYNDKEASLNRFISNYSKLSDDVKKYLVIENDDKLFTVEDILTISSQTGIPCVFDNLHHVCNPSLFTYSEREIFEAIKSTWREADGRMKVHYSQQDNGKRQGAHSETIDLNLFLKDLERYYDYDDCDIMLEVKDKNRSFKKVDALMSLSQRKLEQEWARYKYKVMSMSQKHYNELRLLFKGNEHVDPIRMYQIIDEALQLEKNLGAFCNACDHVWGYFKKVSTDSERKQFLNKKLLLRDGKLSDKAMLGYLYRLTLKYDVDYLKDSYFFK